MVKSLDRKWKEVLYACSGFGPNLLMVLMGAYFTDAVNPAAMGSNTFQVINGTCLILPAVFPILWMLGKIFDGIIDIPFAAITDTLSTKWGRRRPAIAVCAVPMILSYAMCWLPIGGANQLINTIWISVWALVFFATYTMCLIAFYGSLSTVCDSEGQRIRVSSFKAFFDTISYCLVYALVPLVLQMAKLHIDKFVFICLPLMLTIVIPLFMIKEGKKYGYPENDGQTCGKVGLIESIKLTFGNRLFISWTVVNCCSFFGLQMFLVGMNAMITGGMGLNGAEMALLNTCAFAPVPIMLYLFNKLKAKKGIRFAYQSCLIAFAVAILSFDVASLFVIGPDHKILQYIIGCTGGVAGSWAIGSFFMMPYMVPAQISSVEEKLTGKNHSAMYFAAQALTTSVVGAVASALVYENIKMLFISKQASGVVYATDTAAAAASFGVAPDSVFNLGTLLVPIIVSVMCLGGFLLAFRMPKDFSAKLVARELKRQQPSLDISSIEAAEDEDTSEKGEIVFVQIALSILSGFIFGFIWTVFLFRSLRKLTGKGKPVVLWLLCCFVPFASAFVLPMLNKSVCKLAAEKGVKPMGKTPIYIILAVLFPILPLNIVALSILQRDANRLLACQ